MNYLIIKSLAKTQNVSIKIYYELWVDSIEQMQKKDNFTCAEYILIKIKSKEEQICIRREL